MRIDLPACSLRIADITAIIIAQTPMNMNFVVEEIFLH